jgi:hypothetical protein
LVRLGLLGPCPQLRLPRLALWVLCRRLVRLAQWVLCHRLRLPPWVLLVLCRPSVRWLRWGLLLLSHQWSRLHQWPRWVLCLRLHR